MLRTKAGPAANAILHKGKTLLGIFKLKQGLDELLLSLGRGHAPYHAHAAPEGKSVATAVLILTMAP